MFLLPQHLLPLCFAPLMDTHTARPPLVFPKLELGQSVVSFWFDMEFERSGVTGTVLGEG